MNPPYSPRRFRLLHPLFISTPFSPTHVRILPETSTSHPRKDNNPPAALTPDRLKKVSSLPSGSNTRS